MFNCDPLTCSRVAFVVCRLPYNNNPNSAVILRSATHYEMRLVRINIASCMFAPIGRPNVCFHCRVLFCFDDCADVYGIDKLRQRIPYASVSGCTATILNKSSTSSIDDPEECEDSLLIRRCNSSELYIIIQTCAGPGDSSDH